MKRKLDTKYNQLLRNEQEGVQHNDAKSILFLRTYPHANFLYEALFLLFQVKYAVNKSDQHSPLLQLNGVELKTFVKTDVSQHQQLTGLQTSLKYFAQCLGASLSVGAFILQFLEYYYATDKISLNTSSGSIPPAPESLDVSIHKGLKFELFLILFCRSILSHTVHCVRIS